MAVDLTGFVYDVKGNPIAGATVVKMAANDANDTSTAAVGSADTTDANGRWDFLGIANGDYDVRITVGASVYWIKHANQVRHEAGSFSDLTLDQGEGDDGNILLLASTTDVTHGATSVAPTDAYAAFLKEVGDDGGLRMLGVTQSDIGIRIQGINTTDVTAKSAGSSGVVGSSGVIVLDARKINGTAITGTYAGNSNLVVIQAGAGTDVFTKFIFDLEGQMHALVSSTTFDAEDDIALVHDIEAHMLPDKFEPERYTREDLEELGLIGKGSWHEENGKVHAMVNFTRLAMLQQGALQQLHGRIKVLERKSLVGRIRTWLGRAA